MFNGNLIHVGGFLLIEFEEGVLRWTMVNYLNGPVSVEATIVEPANARYKQGRCMVIHLKYAREYRSKDNPPPLWGMPHAA
jgi:hypothetical protein